MELYSEDFSYDKHGNISINLFRTDDITETGGAIGKVGLKPEGNDWFSLQPDGYDFNIEKGFSARIFLLI